MTQPARTAQTEARQIVDLATAMRAMAGPEQPVRCTTSVWSSHGEFIKQETSCSSVMSIVGDIIRTAAGDIHENEYYKCAVVGRSIRCGFVATVRGGGFAVDFDEESRPTKYTTEEYVGDEYYGGSETTVEYGN